MSTSIRAFNDDSSSSPLDSPSITVDTTSPAPPRRTSSSLRNRRSSTTTTAAQSSSKSQSLRDSFRRQSINAAHDISLTWHELQERRQSQKAEQRRLLLSTSLRIQPQDVEDHEAGVVHDDIDTAATRRDTATVTKTGFFSIVCPAVDARHYQTLVSLAVFSYLGESLRYFTEELFGLSCHDPGTVGWDATGWAPCTTAPGNTQALGGAFFTDLPTNIIGCYFMGLLVSGDQENITAVNLPMACLPRYHPFQSWTMTHVGLRTGFCGALTTFASWNTQMVVMICGGTVIPYSQWVSALWGYLIGLYCALQSYVFGRDCAYALSRYFNKALAREADIIMDKKEIGVLVNRDLPDFERRFLHDIVLLEEAEEEEDENENAEEEGHPSLHKYGPINVNNKIKARYKEKIHHLQQWKAATKLNRHMDADYTHELHEIEKALLVDHVEPRDELLEVARDSGWDVNALRNWIHAMKDDNKDEEEAKVKRAFWNEYSSSTFSCEVVLTAFAFLLFTGLLIFGAIHDFSTTEAISITYRTQFLSALLAPFGTIQRYYLSRLNGRIKNRRWEWLPIGTLLANMFACIVSALMQAVAHSADPTNHLGIAFLNAVKVGYAGSLSTVSTFAAETIGLFRALPRYFWAWYYSFGSLALGLLLGVIFYVWSVV